ncbi:MAG: ABC transporter ATP-binding protein [Bacteroidota bacterium]
MPFLKRIFSYALGHKKWLWWLLAMIGITAFVDAAFPLIWLSYIDDWVSPAVEAHKNGQDMALAGLGEYAAVMLGVFLFQVLSIGGFIYATSQIKERVIFDLRRDMFARLQHLSYSFYDKNAIGHLAIRLTSDVNKVAQVISWGLVDGAFGVIMIVVSLVAMFALNWQLSLIVLLTIPLLLFLAIKVRVMLLGYSRKARKAYSQMAAYLTEHINGMEVNKATVQEERASESFQTVSESLRDSAYRSSFYSAMYNPIVVVTGSLAAALVIYVGGDLASLGVGALTVGTLAAFFGYARMIFEPIFDLTRYYATAQDSLSAGERIFSLIDEPIAIKDKAGVADFPSLKGDIRFQDINFGYLADELILQDFNLHIPAGQSVALVGATGSGKTTISNLVARFYEPQSGEILVDGIEQRDGGLNSYRSQLGIILQTPHLFSGTIRENLAYGRTDATDAEIKAALELIGAHDFVGRLEEQVGEEGGNLSAGEKQMLSFARALLKDPRIMIMDEATSSVDTLAEMKIQAGIREMIKGRTAIIIAHRLSTIRDCDRILVIQNGKIIEDGSHAELIDAKGHYHQLYTRQARAVVA